MEAIIVIKGMDGKFYVFMEDFQVSEADEGDIIISSIIPSKQATKAIRLLKQLGSVALLEDAPDESEENSLGNLIYYLLGEIATISFNAGKNQKVKE